MPVKGPPAAGSDEEQAARLRHAIEKHGWEVIYCFREGCAPDCEHVRIKTGSLKPCGPECPFWRMFDN